MFSGIVEECATVRRVEGSSGLKTIVVESLLDHSSTRIGDSICIDGVCLTVVRLENRLVSFEASTETLRRSTLGLLRAGSKVNLERSLVLGDRIHGHLVFGHVDTVVTLINRRRDGEAERLEWRMPPDFRKYIVSKGSVAVSGVSLTVGEVRRDAFSIFAIPHTLAVTTLSKMNVAEKANLEVDMLARYVESMLGPGREA